MFLSVKGSGSDLDIINLEEHLEAYIETLPEELRQMPVELRSVDVQKYQPLLFKKVILQSSEFLHPLFFCVDPICRVFFQNQLPIETIG